MFWMCNDQTVINLDHVTMFEKVDNPDFKECKPKISFYFKNGQIDDVYDSIEQRDNQFKSLTEELKVII